MKSLPIALCIITRNSADRIESMVEKHRKVCDEIIIADQSSTDGTWEIVQKIADLPIKRRCKGASDPDRNWLYALSKSPWILYLDDDEYLPPETIKALPKLIKDNVHVYWFKHRNLVDGIDTKEVSGDDYHPRLFKKGSLRYIDQQTNVDHTFPEPANNAIVAYTDYYIVHDRTMEKIIKANRNRNKVATPQQIQMQENYIDKLHVFFAKRGKKD